MTDTPDIVERRVMWVIRKGGYFYRPNAQGYTLHLYDAGVWPEDEAQKLTNADALDPVTAHPYSEWLSRVTLGSPDAAIAERDAELLRLRGEVERLTKDVELKKVEIDAIDEVDREYQDHLTKLLNDERARADALQAQLEKVLPQLIASAPLDGTHIDIFINGTRVPDAWWGRPDHSCGEAGRYCDSCPTYDGWCDMFGYITGTEGYEEDTPTHWALPLTIASLTEGEAE